MSSNLQLNKSQWTPVTLGDVVSEVRTSTKNPAADGIDRVVGLEHIDPECIHLRRWDSLDNGTTFTKKFRKGHVLFGRRRAYLKKAALADFDGICSGDITVMEAKEALLPELLPFLVNNDKFFDYAVQHSAGGLSPRTKFKDIANYEFLLPPKDQQAKLAELLWAADDALQTHYQNHAKLITLRDASRKDLFSAGIAGLRGEKEVRLKRCKSGLIRSDWSELRFSEAISIANGQVDPTEDRYSSLIQIGPERIEKNTGKILEHKSAEELGISSGNYLFTNEDILYSKIRPYFKKVANPNFTGLCSADVYPLRVTDPGLTKEFLFYYLLTEQLTQTLLRFQNRTGMPKVNRDELMCMYIPVPSLDEQKVICSMLSEIDGTIDTLKINLDAAFQLLKSLINQIF